MKKLQRTSAGPLAPSTSSKAAPSAPTKPSSSATPTSVAGNDAFAGTASTSLSRPLEGGGVAHLKLRGVQKPSLASLLVAMVPPRPDLTVLELGGPSATEPYARTRGQVTAFVESAAEQSALDATSAYHHVEVRGGASLAELGVNAGRFDVVVAHAPPDGPDAAQLARSVAPGGTLVVTAPKKKAPRALLAAAEAAGLTLVKRTATADGAWAYVFHKAGEREPLPVDRTACVDRARVAQLIGSPLVQGPAAVEVVDDNDATLRAQIDAMKHAFARGVAHGDLDVHTVPFPDRVARVATQGDAHIGVLALFAHPDDESGYAAGALAQLASQGQSIHCASATDGGGGLDAQGTSGGSLAAIRRRELDGAAHALGIGGVSVLGLADTGMYLDDHRAVPVTPSDALAAWGVDAALEKLVRVIRERRPRTILGFDPTRDPDYGLHGHHLALGLAVAVAIHLAADPRAFPEQGLRPWSVHEHWAVVPSGAEGGQQVSVAVDVDKKRAAMEAHETQAVSLDGKLADVSATETWHRFQGRASVVAAL